MFNEWKKRRELKKQIASLKEREAKSRALTDKNSPEYDPEAKPEIHGYNISYLQQRLADLETNRLMHKARKLGIQLSQTPSWWEMDESAEPEQMPDGSYSGKFYLTKIGKVGVSKLIREEKRKNVEWWVKIITPILSAIIALLGLLVGLVSVSKK
jgi:lipopolysaccharide export LptBFGC system permease protein LptF